MKTIDNIKGIIWDWNGTLLDDAQLAVSTMNQMLEKRGIGKLSMESYKSVFTFPVKNYYQKIGFDFEQEPFEIPANEFIDLYNSQVGECQLHPGVLHILSNFQDRGFKQFILSAMEQTVLDKCLLNYKIDRFFEGVSGLDNIYATSKIGNGHKLIAEQNLVIDELVLVGDTVHDFEVANALGCRCVLISNGHQSKDVLQTTGVLVLDSVDQLINCL